VSGLLILKGEKKARSSSLASSGSLAMLLANASSFIESQRLRHVRIVCVRIDR
jgi:hypothetical protein